VRQTRAWVPLNASEQAAYAALVASWRVGVFGGPPMPGPREGASVWPTALPGTALVDISPPQPGVVGAPAFGSDCAAFYGAGGRAAPDMLRLPLVLPGAAAPASNDDGCALAGVPLQLAPGASATLAFLWAYDEAPAPGNGGGGGGGGARDLPALVAKLAPAVAAGTLVNDTVRAWLAVSTRVEGVPPWISREALWHSYMLLSAATVDGAWGERMIDQGTAYRYVTGAQIAVRDPAQHLLAALPAAPALARSVLRYLLAEALPSAAAARAALGADVAFALPYGAANFGQITNLELRPSDQEVYVLHAAAEYFFATRDAAFFDEPLTLYGAAEPSTVAAALLLCLDFAVTNVSVGAHGLMRIQTSDWSDSACTMFMRNCTGPGSSGWDSMFAQGESVLNAAMAAYVLPRFADVLDAVGGGRRPAFAAGAAAARGFAAGQVLALNASGWNANRTWLKRAFLSSEAGWLGEAEVFGTQHAWALLAGAVAGDEAARLVATLGAALSAPAPFGMPVLAPPRADAAGQAPGEGENGGVWPALNHPLVMAFAAHNASLAWDEWARNSLRTSALAFPAYWGSVWSSADNSRGPAAPAAIRGRAGTWVATWPTQCQHRHAWPLVSLARLAGVAFDARGLLLAPGDAAPGGGAGGAAPWALRAPAASIARTARSAWAGHWAPEPRARLLARAGAGARAAPPQPLALRGALPVAPGARACEAAVACAGAPRARWHTPAPRAPSLAEARRAGGADAAPFALVDVELPAGLARALDACGELEWEVVCEE